MSFKTGNLGGGENGENYLFLKTGWCRKGWKLGC